MSAARRAWEGERAELTREINHQQSIAEQLADQLAAVKATAESREGRFSDLKKIAGEIDRCLLLARSGSRAVTREPKPPGGSIPVLPESIRAVNAGLITPLPLKFPSRSKPDGRATRRLRG